ncbi:lipoxygenase family protein [uncultured Shewanella sp.]|uniref:lipoxygenase family protein n=1 Tax=uncultured Shewanella sp. TaxID=173975 RepID=UPI00260975C2|nr:lipoxygenase family protein [uncultured Shewanella sp.]
MDSHSPILPQNASKAQQHERENLLEQQRKRYQWNTHSANLMGVPLVSQLNDEELPTLEWKSLICITLSEVMTNFLAVMDDFKLRRQSDVDFTPLKKSHQRILPIVEHLKLHQAPHHHSLWHTFMHLIHHTEFDRKNLMDEVESIAWPEIQKTIKHINQVLHQLEKANTQSGLSTDSYQALFKTLKLPRIASKIKEDHSFANLRLAGPNPMLLKNVTQFPPHFPLTNDMIKHLFIGNDNLEKALQEQRIFICDYKPLSILSEQTGIFQDRKKNLNVPIAAFMLNANKHHFLPIAIQLSQNPATSPLFIPPSHNETDYTWQYAKNSVNYADANYHELIVHLGRTHLIAEAFAIATHRQLPCTHPINRLLLPHFEGTLFINSGLESDLIAAHGPIANIFAGQITASQQAAVKSRLSFDFSGSYLPTELSRRGVFDPQILPYFPYRDDGLKIWHAIAQWSENYVYLYYESDSQVISDPEIQAWHSEVRSLGKIHNIPTLTSRHILAEVLTMIIFTTSAQHAAINFPQRNLMSFSPIMTGALWDKRPISSQDETAWLKTLPPIVIALEQQMMLTLLGSIHYRKLGEYKDNHFPYKPWFKDKKVTETNGPLVQFQNQLLRIENDINTAIITRQSYYPDCDPYDYLLPSKIPCSINI